MFGVAVLTNATSLTYAYKDKKIHRLLVLNIPTKIYYSFDYMLIKFKCTLYIVCNIYDACSKKTRSLSLMIVILTLRTLDDSRPRHPPRKILTSSMARRCGKAEKVGRDLFKKRRSGYTSARGTHKLNNILSYV